MVCERPEIHRWTLIRLIGLKFSPLPTALERYLILFQAEVKSEMTREQPCTPVLEWLPRGFAFQVAKAHGGANAHKHVAYLVGQEPRRRGCC